MLVLARGFPHYPIVNGAFIVSFDFVVLIAFSFFHVASAKSSLLFVRLC